MAKKSPISQTATDYKFQADTLYRETYLARNVFEESYKLYKHFISLWGRYIEIGYER